ncbi:YraN family protein [Candidatus Parcubacteria bacterium]|nr:MAG: YraN family protein [Candidatus Parcubacteria bacterium]
MILLKYVIGMDKKLLGQKGEALATEFLGKEGYFVVARNYTTPLGEIDIIARKDKTIMVIEVKTSLVEHFSKPEFSPELRVNNAKQKRLIKLGQYYLMNEIGKVEVPWEINIIGVEINAYGLFQIRHWRQAVVDI